MELEVYGGGDILVKYGNRSQWFPNPLNKMASFNMFHVAHAMEPRRDPALGFFYQHDSMEGSKLLRERYYQDGTMRRFFINPLTGVWSEPEVSPWTSSPPSNLPGIRTHQYPTIDLTK